ncbi:MAG TPA: hypothetical protein VNA67_00655 [Pseudonocardiaceae bacterium]|nr:hypothetical protein [Pseudonocardiaceae bacterium]
MRDQIRLASLIMATGDSAEAAALGTQALDWGGILRSRRATDDLRRLAQPHASRTEVTDLRDRICCHRLSTAAGRRQAGQVSW